MSKSAVQESIQASVSGFETTFITRAEMADDALETLNQRLKSVVSEYKGDLILTEDMGRQKLAYPIQKESRGHYTYLAYTGKGQVVQEIERALRLNEHVLRFLSVNLSKDFDAEKFKAGRIAAKEAAKQREVELEARREERAAERRSHGEGRGRDRDYHHHHDDMGDGSDE